MRKRFYFFADPTSLAPQAQTQTFGPQDAESFRLTSTHPTTTDAPAIAVCDGTICLQDAGGGLLNIILKPRHQPAENLPFIKFFVYKGVKKSSLMNDNELIAGSAPFVDAIRGAWEDADNTNPISESGDVTGLALSKPEEGYGDTDPLDNLFLSPNSEFQLPSVSAGDAIGKFQTGLIGFEIMLERLGVTPTLGQARSLETLLTVTGFTVGDSAPSDDYGQFKLWHAKEACLAYLDACAFFGSFGATPLYFKANAVEHRCNSAQEIQANLLLTFGNARRIYLDIRNDYGLSLNYFKDYAFAIGFSGPQASLAPTYVATDWPIYIFELQDIVVAGSVTDDYFYTKLALPCGQNARPLIHRSRAFVTRNRRLKAGEMTRELALPGPGDTTGLLEPFEICLPLADAGTSFSSAYFRINLYDQDRTKQQGSGLSPRKNSYLDGLFRPAEMLQPLARMGGKLCLTIWHEELLVNMLASGGPAYIGYPGVARDDSTTTLFVMPNIFVSSTATNSPTKPMLTTQNSNYQVAMNFLEKIGADCGGRRLVKRALQFDPASASTEVMLYQAADGALAVEDLQGRENPEDWISLAFENDEFSQMFAPPAVPGVPAAFLVMSSVNVGLDEDGNPFARISLASETLVQNGSKVEKMSVPLDKEIFADGYF